MGCNIMITLKSGRQIRFDKVNGDIEEIQKKMNRLNFIRFGKSIFNCAEIEMIEEVN